MSPKASRYTKTKGSDFSIDSVHLRDYVNSSDRALSATGALSNAIHRAAGAELLAACQALGGCPTGEARITPGFNLPAQWVIHTVCPTWQGGNQGEAELLGQCYLNCLNLALQHSIREIAFPALGTGAKGFPPDRAAQIALETFSQVLLSTSAIGRILVICADSAVHQHFTVEFQRVAGW